MTVRCWQSCLWRLSRTEQTSSLQILLLRLPGSTRRPFVAIEKSFLRTMAPSKMKLEASIKDSASSTMSLYVSNQRCGYERMQWRKVHPTWLLESFASGSTLNCCPRAFFHQISHAPSQSGLPPDGFIVWAFVSPATRREPMLLTGRCSLMKWMH